MSLASHFQYALISLSLWAACESSTTVVPALCYDECNNAFVEAQLVGKVPALCSPESAFTVSMSRCRSCISAYGDGNSSSISVEFRPFLDYCSTNTTSINIISSSFASTVLSSIELEIASLQSEAALLRISYSVLDRTTISATPGLPITTVYGAITPPSISSTPLLGNANPSSTGLSNDSSTTSSTSHAWIAGAVIGSVAGILAIILLIFFVRRRIRSGSAVQESAPGTEEKPNFEKAQLHADSLPRKDTSELLGSLVVPAELPAREDVAVEMADQHGADVV